MPHLALRSIGQADGIEFQLWGYLSLYMDRAGSTCPPKPEVGVRMCTAPPAVSGATASCCLKQKGLPAPSAAHSTGMNFANNLFNHVYELSVHLSQVGFSAMMKSLGCEAGRLSFSISASWCGLSLPALLFPPPPMFRRRTGTFLGLVLLLKSSQRAFVFPTGQRGCRSSTGNKMTVVEIASGQGWWLEAAKLSLDPWSPDCVLSVPSPRCSCGHSVSHCSSRPVLESHASCSCWGQPTCAELWSVALVCSHGILLECH